MSNTTNYNLNKPTYGTRNWDIPLNQNFDVIDSTMKEIDDKIGILSNKASIVINVKVDFGAKTDGSDNITAFTNLSNYVNSLPVLLCEPVEIVFPSGEYKYSGGLNFTRPVKLVGYNGAILNYTGNGIAIKLGADGLIYSNYDKGLYTVKDLIMTGGTQMSNGIYFNNFITVCRLEGVSFYSFGNPNAFGVYFAGNNWDAIMLNCSWFSYGNTAQNWVRVYPNGINATRFRMIGCLGTMQNTNRGIGIWVDGANNEISHCKIEGFSPNIRIGGLANNCIISNVYFETNDNNGCIQYGAPTGDPYVGNYTVGLTVRDCYANLHNTDQSTTSYFLQPTNSQSGLQRTLIERVIVVGSNREIVKQNDLLFQIGNIANDNYNSSGLGVHTTGNNISSWGGTQGHLKIENKIDEATFFRIRAGKTVNQYAGIVFEGFDGTELGSVQITPSKWMQLVTNGAARLHIDQDGQVGIGATPTNDKLTVGGVVRAQSIKISQKSDAVLVGNGTIFEDFDGKLKYKNLAGTIYDLTL